MEPKNLIEFELLRTGGLHMFVCMRACVCAHVGMGGIVETQDQDRRTFSD